MIARLTKAAPTILPQALRCALPKTLAFSPKRYSASFQSMSLTPQVPQDVSLDDLPSINPHVSTYIKELYQYLAVASIAGISSAHLLAMTVPLGFPPAFLILTGFGLQQIGSEYVAKARQQQFVYKDDEGKMQHGSSNSSLRKLGFLTSCLGYSCVLGSLIGMVPLAPAALPVSALTCLFSTLGHLGYCKFAAKANFKPINLFISGLLSGVLGLNFLTSGSMMVMLNSTLHLESLEVSTYLGLMLYNLFSGYDSQKTVEDVRNGKGDYLKHANKFLGNWLYALIPHFLMSL